MKTRKENNINTVNTVNTSRKVYHLTEFYKEFCKVEFDDFYIVGFTYGSGREDFYRLRSPSDLEEGQKFLQEKGKSFFTPHFLPKTSSKKG